MLGETEQSHLAYSKYINNDRFLEEEVDSSSLNFNTDSKYSQTYRKSKKKLSDRFIPNRKASKLNIAFSNVHSD